MAGPLISERTVLSIRKVLERTLTDTCVILRQNPDLVTGIDEGNYITMDANCPCSVTVADPGNNPFASGRPFANEGRRADRLIRVPVGKDVQIGDRIAKGALLYAVQDLGTDETNPICIVINGELLEQTL